MQIHKVHKVRLGHATNSSSTHSLVMLDGIKDSCTIGEFGWNHFTAASKPAKESYFSILLRDALAEHLNYESAGHIVEALTGGNLSPYHYDNYIDHQSVIDLPTSRDGKGINWEFCEAFKNFLLRDGLVILGGNDNDDDSHPLLAKGKIVSLPLPRDTRKQFWARQDGDYWTLFNPETGAKVRFSFDDPNRVIEKASAPELVDLCITHYCTRGCPYCYQDSGLDGQHAGSITRAIPYSLAELGVFEVAIGGGEPTEHPEFVDLIKSLRRNGTVPNFSTRNHNWFHIPANRDVLQLVGKAGFSVSNYREASNFCDDIVARYNLHHKVAFHIVDRTVNKYEFHNLLSLARDKGIDVVVLGFKDVGRGGQFTKKQDRWIEAIRYMREAKKGLPRIGVDTAIVKEYEEEIGELRVHPVMLAGDEGKFSMYIDLVDSVVGRSSYEQATFEKVSNMDSETIKQAFQKW